MRTHALLNQWQQVVATYDTSTASPTTKIYVNGVLATAPVSLAVVTWRRRRAPSA